MFFQLSDSSSLLRLSGSERCLRLLDLGLEYLQLLRVDALVFGENGLVARLPALVVLFEQLDLVLLGFELCLEYPKLLLERLDLGLGLAQLVVEAGELADIRLVLVAQRLVAFAQEFGGVDRFEEIGVVSRVAQGVACSLALLQDSGQSMVAPSDIRQQRVPPVATALPLRGSAR